MSYGADLASPRVSLRNAMKPEYYPSHLDILTTRQPNRIDQHRLRIRRVDYAFIDAVGNRPLEDATYLQRHSFAQIERVFATVFAVDLACYDRIARTAFSVSNEMKLILHRFGTLVNSLWLRNKEIILLFVGWETFASKLRSSPLNNHFPRFDGGHDSSLAFDYILGQFISINEQQTRGVYAHVCNIGDGSTLSFLTRQFRELHINGVSKIDAMVHQA